MSYLEIILPFGIPPASLAKELVKQLKTPSLAVLLGHVKNEQSHDFDEFARLLPHEFWLTQHFNQTTSRVNSPALSHSRMQSFGIQVPAGYWFSLSPIHIHIARDHMVMTDPRRLDITEQESHALFEAAKEICEELGKTLLYGDAKTWFLRADDWATLQTASLDAAAGHNMEIWIAKGEHEVAWRKLQNEIQMLWHIHPVNQQRDEQGRNTINSVWLHSGSAELQQWHCQFGLNHFSGLNPASSKAEAKQSVLIDDLLEPALNSDWGNWLACVNQLEQNWFAPALQALQSKQIKTLNLVLSDGQNLSELTCQAPQTWKFWRKPSLDILLKLAHQSQQKPNS
ncbi:hypothetical protein [Undibacterium sp.]|uniref:hypothetical protein n=1 Tax=Undibacterium sp. TaxID=1914977 RepID=UPI0037537399